MLLPNAGDGLYLVDYVEGGLAKSVAFGHDVRFFFGAGAVAAGQFRGILVTSA
ncbi:MAG: hypothetical protein M3Y67_08090 [Pseudomonadota bacterium]|nr:hypothetical protein [Pseudomonadota bacterium]